MSFTYLSKCMSRKTKTCQKLVRSFRSVFEAIFICDVSSLLLKCISLSIVKGYKCYVDKAHMRNMQFGVSIVVNSLVPGLG